MENPGRGGYGGEACCKATTYRLCWVQLLIWLPFSQLQDNRPSLRLPWPTETSLG